MTTPLLSPRMLTALRNFYPDTGTVQQATRTADAAGQLISTWANLAAHVDLPCAIQSVSGQETETPDQTYVITTHRIALRGNYPSITEAMRFVSGGVSYDIERVHHDSHTQTTYLDVQVVS